MSSSAAKTAAVTAALGSVALAPVTAVHTDTLAAACLH